MSFKVVTAACAVLFLFSCSQKGNNSERSAESTLNDLKLSNGIRAGLFAAEPMFTNPTNIAVDAKGRVWVCEAYNYRNQLNPKNPVKKEGDRIMILEDTDGDGKADKSKVFYQGTDVNSALGICVLGDKVFVSCSPNVFVFTDSNGDDVPDHKKILYTGIQGEQHDHGMHTFIFGHDGRLYFNMGNEGKLLLSASGDMISDIHGRRIVTNGKPFRQGMAMRSDINGDNIEVLGHNFRNNYELAVDPFGTVWQSDNDDDGNKGTRINYVMEHGNFGYTDEITGAGWSSRRTNREEEIPLRHWHLNDPGVVPNVLQTGSGSPSGITIYDGTMLPQAFRGKLVHAEAGHNVVRAYDVKNSGAGYTATIVNLVEGQKDQWFRPVDVATAPDGSLLIADWYDPGVGGHQAGDIDRGRIYRITGEDTNYRIPAFDTSTPDGASNALLNPNMDVRYRGWMALQSMGAQAEPALKNLWSAQDDRHRAQAFWLLILLGNADEYIAQAIADKNPDIRILALRGARKIGKDMLPLVSKLSDDPSPQVRREAALSLRGNGSDQAAQLWAKLADAHDGKDRWYLEALGIASDPNADKYFLAWKKLSGKNWQDEGARDIIWRSRSAHAIPMLGQMIADSDEKSMLRYFRAFDFHTDASKQKVLADIAVRSKDLKVLYALKHMDASQFKMTPAVRSTLKKALDQNKGNIEYVELTAAFRLSENADELLSLAIEKPESDAGKEAVKILLDWNRTDLFEKAFSGADAERSQSLVRAVWPNMWHSRALQLMESVITDTTKNLEVRKLAVRTFGGPWTSEDRLVELAKEKRIPRDLHQATAGVFQTAWRPNIREATEKYLDLPGLKEGEKLPSVSVLAARNGAAAKGREVFKSVCSNCHTVKNEGVNFGPDLSEIGDKLSKEALYTSILFPDQGISFGYEAYRFRLKDGSTAFGRIVSETNEKVDVQYMQTQQAINKSDIVSRTKMATSMMPSNLHSTISEDELVDLVEYLVTLRKEGSAISSN